MKGLPARPAQIFLQPAEVFQLPTMERGEILQQAARLKLKSFGRWHFHFMPLMNQQITTTTDSARIVAIEQNSHMGVLNTALHDDCNFGPICGSKQRTTCIRKQFSMTSILIYNNNLILLSQCSN